MDTPFAGLVAVVQYRRAPESGEFDPWHNMAAFDSRGAADSYADLCAAGDRPWEYRVVDVPDTSNED